jgi:ppGpp synthetase/RelA/SpoT-type nucleotidyltranferase
MEHLLQQLLSSRGFVAHSVSARVKEASSLRRKLRRHHPPYESLDRVTDLLAARIVTYFPDELDIVGGIVEEEFSVDATDSRDARLDSEPERFGYRGLHYVVSISPARAALPEWTRFAGIRFEIQLRDILQHAWAEIEHDRGYHTYEVVPAAVRRRWSRLAALLEVADSEFMALRDEATYLGAAGAALDAMPAADDHKVAGPIILTAVSSIGYVAPGERSRGPVAVSITFREPPGPGTHTIRVALESARVTFEGTPIVSSNGHATALIESSRRAIVIKVTFKSSTLPVVTVSSLLLRASSQANPGPIQASVCFDDGPRRSIASLGTVGAPTGVVAGVAASPTVFAGLDSQSTGVTTLVELQAGALVDESDLPRRIRVSLVDTSSQEISRRDAFTRPPAMVVTRGDVKLIAADRGAATAATGSILDQTSASAEWAVYSASSVPSTLEIRGTAIDGSILPSGPTNGPRVNASSTVGSVGLRIEIVDAAGEVIKVIGDAVVGFRQHRAQL